MAVKRKSYAERTKMLKGLITNINKNAGKNVINFASDEEMQERLRVEFIETPSLALNSAFGGFPRGNMTLVAGNPDSGKTSLLLETIGYNQREDKDFIAGWCESEGSLSDELLDMFGIDRDRFIVYECDHENGAAETALDYVIALAQAGVDFIVVNSLKALVPKKEVSDSMEDQNIALSARLNSKFCRKISSLLSNTGTALAVVQHKATDIGSYGA